MLPKIQSLLDALRTRVAEEDALAGYDIVGSAQPSIRLTARRVPDDLIAVGASRIGGVPDVPPGFEWPYWTPPKEFHEMSLWPVPEDRPVPLGFIAQLDLSDLTRINDTLPNAGWLWFFYDRYCEPPGSDPKERGYCRVIYMDVDRANLRRMPPPADSIAEHTAEPCSVETSLELTLPDDLPEIEYPSPADKGYEKLKNSIIYRDGQFIQHRLLGHPQSIQPVEMGLECQLASNGVSLHGGSTGREREEAKALEAGIADWRLLLQVDTDEDGPGWMWGDVGRIYFWIRRQDLAARSFENVWLIFQCY